MRVAVFQLSFFGVNSYVVWDPATLDAVVVDPAFNTPEEREALDRFIKREGLRLTGVINTHMHIDHVIGNGYVTGHYGVKVKAHEADAPLGERVANQAAMFGLGMDVQAVKADDYLKAGDIVHVGQGELKVLHVPGHSPGSIVLYDAKDGFLIAGDVLFQGSIGRTDLPGGNHQQLISGIKEQLLSLPDSTVVYPGHGPATTIGEERRSNPFLR